MAAQFTLGRHQVTGHIMNIQDVTIDEKFQFECAQCKQSLVCVLKDDKVSKHFKHKKTDQNCNPAPETLLHLTAKEIIVKNKQIHLPDGKGVFSYDEAKPETIWNKRFPDVTLKNQHQTLLVEVVVSNPISYEKELHYHHHSADCLIIDLQRYDRFFNITQMTMF